MWVFLSALLQTVLQFHVPTLLNNVFSGTDPPFPYSLSIDFFFFFTEVASVYSSHLKLRNVISINVGRNRSLFIPPAVIINPSH